MKARNMIKESTNTFYIPDISLKRIQVSELAGKGLCDFGLLFGQSFTVFYDPGLILRHSVTQWMS